MNIFEQINELEDQIQGEIRNAPELPQRGVNNPEIVTSKIDGLCASMVGLCQSKIITLDGDKIELEKRLQPIMNQVKDSETLIVNDWNKKERVISNRAEGEAAIRIYNEENKFKFKNLIFYALFFAEFCYGYYIFKNIVLPDNNFQNYVTSVVVGAMVLLIGVFAKLLPDSQTDIKKFELYKKINTALAAISMVVFIVCLVQMRETTTSFDMSNATAKVEKNNYQELAFNLSLLCTIIFGSAFFTHWHRCFPKRLLKKKHDEGKELQHWYEGDHYYYKQASIEYTVTQNKVEKELKPQLSILKEQIAKYDPSFIKSIKRQALSQFMIGTYTNPLTEEKAQARSKSETLLMSLN
ncbi:MAG: hypothetical protein HOP30_15915 [Cyclobacteriaceae bacterium]|nr:hypothetical protein [Cyclobacteriaceae bacterium]